MYNVYLSYLSILTHNYMIIYFNRAWDIGVHLIVFLYMSLIVLFVLWHMHEHFFLAYIYAFFVHVVSFIIQDICIYTDIIYYIQFAWL